MTTQDKRHRRVRKVKEGPNFSGQHLMINKRLIHDLIAMAELPSHAMVLDIGAGPGTLTLPLAMKAKKVLAVENDRDFIKILNMNAEKQPNIRVIQNDFLQIPLPRQPFYVVANIPYAITTPILGKLLDQPGISLQRAVLVIEKGAAKRFTTYPMMNPRILKWRMWFDLEMGRTILPSNFSPPPRVDSAVLFVRRKKKPMIPIRYHSQFMALARYGLKHPQLPVFAALKGVFTPPQIKHLVKNLGIDRNAPICSLDEQQWGIVFNSMLRYVKPFRWPR